MYHEPVLLKEAIEGINPQSNENFIDCTLGDGGHTLEILKRTAPKGCIMAFELDKKAIAVAEERLKKAGVVKRVKIINDNFRNLKKYKDELPQIDGILADLGLRSGQLEEGGGGFSFKSDEPLDMRFGGSAEGTVVRDPEGSSDPEWERSRSAAEIVNTYSVIELAKIFRDYGDEKNNLFIARAIVEARRKRLITTTGELSEVILDFYRRKFQPKADSPRAKKSFGNRIPWVGGIHPATRVFQALRIEANDELGALKQLVEDGVDILSSGGRMAIISYHSLEDRIVKRFYRTSPHLVVKTKKPIIPSEEEAQKNRRARSAKLRIASKVGRTSR